MRRYLLDTSPLAALLLARPAAVSLITPWMERHEAATSILVYAEVVEYIKGRSDEDVSELWMCYPPRSSESST